MEKLMALFPQWLIVVSGGLVVFAFIGALICIHIATDELVSPPRRPLQDYHHEWLNNQVAHGIRVQRVDCMEGRVPCLIVEPDGKSGCSKRGSTIRNQLTSFGLSPMPFGAVCCNLILLHGRHGRREDMLPIAERFCAVGFRCLLPDLPGHGESQAASVGFGTGSSEADLASAVLHECAHQLAFEKSPAAIWGISMGGAYAISSASIYPDEWCSIAIVSSFDTLDGVVDEQSTERAGFMGPILASAVRLNAVRKTGLDTGSVRPVEWARKVHTPVLVVHGTTDPLIKTHRGRALFEAFASQDKKWVEVAGGNHGNVLVTPMPLYATMASWLLQHLPAKSL